MAVHVFGTSPSPPSPVEEVDTQNFPLDATLQTPQAASLDFLPLLQFPPQSLRAPHCRELHPGCLLTDTAQLLGLPQVLAVHQKGNDPILSHQYFLQ